MSDIQAKNVANMPGHIQFDRGGGDAYSGCLLAQFTSVNACNNFFAQSPGYLVVQIAVKSDECVYALYTSVMSAEDMEDLREWSQEQHNFLAAKRAAREQAKLSSEDAVTREAAENARLRELGRKCEQNHKKTKGK